MKVSVIVPGFGKDRLLADAQAVRLRGIVGEDAEVLVPDGSNVAEARNNGLRTAKGEWIAWVDADDEVTADWFPEICRAITAAERDGEIDGIVFDMTVVRETGETHLHYGREAVVESRVLVNDMLRDLRIGSYACLHVTRRCLWTDERFERISVMEDYVTMHRVLARARKVAYVAKPLYRYIVRKGSLCNCGADGRRTIFDIAIRRARSLGGAANIGTMVAAFNILYDGLDRTGAARRWIRHHLLQALCDREVPAKWKLKFALAVIGVMIRRPK